MHHEGLLPDSERPAFHAAYQSLGDALEACVEYLILVYNKSEAATRKDGKDIHVSVMALFAEFIELMDGLTLLIYKGSSSNCIHLLRSAYEIQLSIYYMLESPEKYEIRSVSYEFWNQLILFDWYNRCNPNTKQGKEARREFAGEEFSTIFDLFSPEFLEIETKKIQSKFEGSRYLIFHNEYKRMEAIKKRPKNWFSLWDGPDTLRNLAKYLKGLSIYDALYRSWSASSHGENSIKRITKSPGGIFLWEAIRSPSGLREKTRHATNMALGIAKLFTENIAIELLSSRNDYFKKNIEPKLKNIANINI